VRGAGVAAIVIVLGCGGGRSVLEEEAQRGNGPVTGGSNGSATGGSVGSPTGGATGSTAPRDAATMTLRDAQSDGRLPVDTAAGGDASADGLCPAGQLWCGATCADLMADNQNCGACGKVCAAGQVCTRGRCRQNCPSHLTECNDMCVETMTDSLNCGACGKACAGGQMCRGGVCH